MPSIEEKAFQNYQENMQYFLEKHDAVYSKIKAFEVLLENGTIQQKYDLEYKNDTFDVIDIKTNAMLYNGNSTHYSNELTDAITFKKNDQVIESFYNLKFSEKAVKKAASSTPITAHSTTAEIIYYYNQHINKEMHLEHIDKFMFLGLGLALHIPKIINKINSDVVLLIEDNLEIFRLSLYTCNYKKTFQTRDAFFSVAQNENEFINTLKTFYKTGSIRNQYLKFSLFSLAYEQKIKSIQSFIITRPEKAYSHERLLLKNKRTLKQVTKEYPFLNIFNKFSTSFFEDKPILVLGAGPSLHTNLEWIQKHQSSFIIITVFAALKSLSKYNISPDIVVQLDEKMTEGVNIIHSFKNDFDFVKNAFFVFNASLPDIYFKTFNQENIFVIEDRTSYQRDRAVLSAASVGEVSYSLSLLFNAPNIYLLGLDLALSDEGLTHAQDHHNSHKLENKNSDIVEKVLTLQKSTLQVKGNFRDKVTTTPLFAMSIPYVNKFTRELKLDYQNVYNMGDGASFEGIEALEIQKCNMTSSIDKKHSASHIKNILLKHSVSGINDSFILNIKNREEQIKRYYLLLKELETSPTMTKETFMQKYKLFFNGIVSDETTELREILLVWLLTTSTYVADLFNTRELKNQKSHTKKMKKIIVNQVTKIIQYYEKYLLKTLKISQAKA